MLVVSDLLMSFPNNAHVLIVAAVEHSYSYVSVFSTCFATLKLIFCNRKLMERFASRVFEGALF